MFAPTPQRKNAKLATETATETAMKLPETFCERREKQGKQGTAGDRKTL
jgi:hypothetical protein